MKWLNSCGAPMKTYQSQWQQQQQQRTEISSQPDVNKETTSKFAQNIKQSASAAASASAFKTPVAMPRAQKLTEESRCDHKLTFCILTHNSYLEGAGGLQLGVNVFYD